MRVSSKVSIQYPQTKAFHTSKFFSILKCINKYFYPIIFLFNSSLYVYLNIFYSIFAGARIHLVCEISLRRPRKQNAKKVICSPNCLPVQPPPSQILITHITGQEVRQQITMHIFCFISSHLSRHTGYMKIISNLQNNNFLYRNLDLFFFHTTFLIFQLTSITNPLTQETSSGPFGDKPILERKFVHDGSSVGEQRFSFLGMFNIS